MPKLYFWDTDLACSLLGIQNSDQLNNHPLKGSLFENIIINEFLKKNFRRNFSEEFNFWSDNIGHEVGVLKVSSNNSPRNQGRENNYP